MKVFGIIPARYASTRFPGKPLIMINDKTMIQHVYDKVSRSKLLDKVIIATDDNRIFEAVNGFGGNVLMTSENHKSGTDRCGEVANALVKEEIAGENDIIINIQGDEPFIDPVQIELLLSLFKNEKINIATLARQINSNKAIFNPNVVKVVFDNYGKAIYFSRQAIPFLRNIDKEQWHESGQFYEHIGIYAFRFKILNELIKLPQCTLELNEKLEQLRWLENDHDIYVNITSLQTHSVDTPEDLEKLKQMLD